VQGALFFVLSFGRAKEWTKLAEGKSKLLQISNLSYNESYKSYITQHPEFPAPGSQIYGILSIKP
jgi:hypothetical protein